MNKINTLIKYIKESKKTVFFGGAGVSTESGLKDFRSIDGIYNEKYDYPPEIILSNNFFYNNTEYFYKFYKEKLNSLNFKPNITHKVLKKLEDNNMLSSIITQNIDGFDQEAGSKNVLELHGSIHRNYCLKCKKEYSSTYIFNTSGVPICNCGGLIKPDVVLYGENLSNKILEKAINEISTADLLIIGGTSLSVYPAASLVNYFRGKHIVIINKDNTEKDNISDLIINDKIGNVFKEIEKQVD